MLQMDLEDNETAMNSFDSQVEELKGTIELLEAQLAQNQTQMSEMEAKLEDSKAQVEIFSDIFNYLHFREENIPIWIKSNL